MGEFFTHPVTLIVLSCLAGIVVTRLHARWDKRHAEVSHRERVMGAVEEQVLPWFERPKPGERDVSLPTLIQAAHSQLFPNGGSSLSDKVRRCEQDSEWNGAALELLGEAAGVALPVRPRHHRRST